MLRLRYRPHGDLRQRLSRAGRHQVPRLRQRSQMTPEALADSVATAEAHSAI